MARTSWRGRRQALVTFVPRSTRRDGGRSGRKIRRYKPAVVALVGVTLYRALLPLVDRENGAAGARARVPLGLQPVTIHGARVFVLPNPSGRNANFTYAEMRSAFRGLARYLESKA